MVCLVSRQGRQLQRYNSYGGRVVVGCIPYKVNTDNEIEVLVITSQKNNNNMMFPKGGWESDESEDEGAEREALEEAGVQGKLEDSLGKWLYKSKRYGILYEGIMFPLNVTKELTYWSEMDVRKRRWVTVAEAREGCRDLWMRQALEEFVHRLSQQRSRLRINIEI